MPQTTGLYSQTIQTLWKHKRQQGSCSLDNKRIPEEPRRLQPGQRTLPIASQLRLPRLCPHSSCSCGKKEFCTLQQWMFAGSCHCLLSQMLHSELSQTQGHPKLYIYLLILYPAIRAALGRIRQAFQGILCCSATRFLLP